MDRIYQTHLAAMADPKYASKIGTDANFKAIQKELEDKGYDFRQSGGSGSYRGVGAEVLDD